VKLVPPKDVALGALLVTDEHGDGDEGLGGAVDGDTDEHGDGDEDLGGASVEGIDKGDGDTDEHGDGDEDLGGASVEASPDVQQSVLGYLKYEHRTGFEDRRWVIPHYARGEEPRRGLAKGGYDWSHQTGRLNLDLVPEYAGAFKAGDVTHGCVHCGKLLRLGFQITPTSTSLNL